jgi:hypothetical protein
MAQHCGMGLMAYFKHYLVKISTIKRLELPRLDRGIQIYLASYSELMDTAVIREDFLARQLK